MNVEENLEDYFSKYELEESAQSWEDAKKDFPIGSLVKCVVATKEQFGVFVDIGVRFPALLLVVNFKNAGSVRYSMDMYPEVGSEIEARIGIFNDVAQRFGLTQKEE